jgi:nicotinamidase-related amidase
MTDDTPPNTTPPNTTPPNTTPPNTTLPNTTPPNTVPSIDPHRAVLLVMDYQPGILSRLPNGDELLGRARVAIAEVRRRGVQVGYVRVAFSDADIASIPETNKSFRAIKATPGRPMHADAPETAVHDRVAPEPDDIVVRKTRVGAFSTTDLDQQLRDRGIDTLILAGISTSGVVLSTVRDGADRDYRVYVLEDATADPDPEIHELLMRKVFPRQAHVITTADLTTLLP